MKTVESTENQEIVKKLNLYLLNQFYVVPYETDEDFYSQFYKRLEDAKRVTILYQ